jgi:hypothetical protein
MRDIKHSTDLREEIWDRTNNIGITEENSNKNYNTGLMRKIQDRNHNSRN